MNIKKYICANLLSFFGNIGFSILLCMIFITIFFYNAYNFFTGLIAYSASLCFGTYIYIIPSMIIMLLFELLIHKITHNKFLLNIPFKNENIRYTYNILFWLGIVCSILYLLFYLWFITR